MQERHAAGQSIDATPLLKRLSETKSEFDALAALWTLQVIGAVDEPLLLAQMNSPHDVVRGWAIQLELEDRQASPGVGHARSLSNTASSARYRRRHADADGSARIRPETAELQRAVAARPPPLPHCSRKSWQKFSRSTEDKDNSLDLVKIRTMHTT